MTSLDAHKQLSGRWGLGSRAQDVVRMLDLLLAAYAEDYDRAKSQEEFWRAQGARAALKRLQQGMQAGPKE